MRSTASNPVYTRTGRTESNAARRVRNRWTFVRRPNENTIQMSLPGGALDKVRRPIISFCDDHDPVEESRIIDTAAAHICFGNVASTRDPFSHQLTRIWRQQACRKVANYNFHLQANSTEGRCGALIQITNGPLHYPQYKPASGLAPVPWRGESFGLADLI